MARTPQASDLMRPANRSGTPALNVPRPAPASLDTRGIGAVYDGARDAMRGLTGFVQDIEKVEDFETKRRLVDFRLETERELEEMRTQMPQGGTGFTEAWKKHYDKRANEFVKTIPESQRDAVQDPLVGNYERTAFGAQNAELDEQVRYRRDSLKETLDNQVAGAMSRPDAIEEFRAIGTSVVRSVDLPPDEKRKTLEDYNRRLEQGILQRRIDSARSPAELKALQAELNAQKKTTDRSDAPDYRGQRTVASIRNNNPGAMWPGPSSRKFGATSSQKLSDGLGQGNKAATFPDAVSGAAALFDLLDNQYSGRTIRSAIGKWSGGNNVNSYLDVLSSRAGIGPDEKITKENLRDPEWSIRFAKAMAWHEAGTEFPLSDRHWAQAHSKAFGVGDTVPDGPYRSLNAEERAEYNNRIAQQSARIVKQIDGQIQEVEKNAIVGIRPRDGDLAQLQKTVDESEDDYLKTRLQSTLDLARSISEMQQKHPRENEVIISRLRARQKEEGSTPEQEERLRKIEQMHANQVQMLKDNALTYSNNSGVVKLEPLNLGNRDSLQKRIEHSQATQQKFGGQLQLFTKGERESFKKAIDSGQMRVSAAAAALTQSWGREKATLAMQQIANDAPESAFVGGHVVTFGKPLSVVDDYEQGHLLSKSKEFKSVGVPKADAQEVVGRTIEDVVRGNPTMKAGLSDVIVAAANKVYEVRARRESIVDFDADLYRQGVRELLGEREVGGIKYGGISESKSGFFYDSDPVIVPHDVRQDSFDDVRNMIKVDMLSSPPLNKHGQPISNDDLASSTFVSMSEGYYVLIARSDTGEPYYDANGDAYVLNFSDVRDRLKARRPDLFYPESK